MPEYKCEIKQTTYYDWYCDAKDIKEAQKKAINFAQNHDEEEEENTEHNIEVIVKKLED